MQQNIYFRKKVWEKLKDEPNKSDLVNKLLEAYYKINQEKDDNDKR